jgi:hypothetical protein
MRAFGPESLVVALWAFVAPAAHAEPPRRGQEAPDQHELTVRSETYAELFRRALLPGPNGSLVSTDTAAPLYEYVSLRATDLDTAWRKDSLDLEFAAWGRAWFGPREAERPFEGDIQSASVRYRHGPVSLRLGRQVVAGGAARFARFDGVGVEAELGPGVQASAYGGWTALPRWNQRPRYEHLGAAPDTLLRGSDALEAAPRGKYWLAGGRLGWGSAERRVGVSFHEQREAGGLAHRNLGIDGRTPLFRDTRLGTSAVLDLDRQRFADTRVWLDISPHRALDLSFEYLHSEPALFLSHQSVLSVFGSAAYDEVGSYVTLRANSALSLDGAAFIQEYDGDRPGGRAELSGRLFVDPSRNTFVRLAYTRVQAPRNGYHSLRSSLSRRLAARFRGTLEAYAYLYDEAIRGYRASAVYAGTLSFEPVRPLSLLWGGSLARSPYADLDAQTELRVTYAWDLSSSGGRR